MQITGSIFDKYILAKFLKISRLALDYTLDNPLWGAIIFDKENQRILYIGWRFSVEVKYPVEESFIVNFQRFRDAVRFCHKPTIRPTAHYVMVEEDNIKFKLKKLDIDYSNFLHPESEDLQYKPTRETLLSDINFCSIAAATDRTSYEKYGVILSYDMLAATDSESNIALVLTEQPEFSYPMLLQLPWCSILQDLGSIIEIAIQDLGGRNATLFVRTRDEFKAIIPVLKVNPNPSMIPYIQSIEPHVTISNLNKATLKKLEVTVDDAYKFVTAYSDNGKIYLESSSKSKGKTVVEMCEGDMGEISVGISLRFLYNIVSMAEYLDLDLDNLVGFVSMGENEEYKYAFSLG